MFANPTPPRPTTTGFLAAPRRVPSTRRAGIGALAFAAVVIVQNVIRGSSAPSNGASASEVLAGDGEQPGADRGQPVEGPGGDAGTCGPGIAAGELGGLLGIGLVGFLIWLAFLVTTGHRLVRADGPQPELIAA